MGVVHVISRSSRKAALVSIKAIAEMHGNRDVVENAFSTASKLTCDLFRHNLINIRSKMGKGPHDSNETDSYAKLLQPFKSQKAYFTSVDS